MRRSDGEDHDRRQKERRRRGDRRPVLAALADDERDEGRHRLRVAARQQESERIFVPGEDEAEDRRRRDAGDGLRQHRLAEGLQPRVAVDERRLLVFARDFVDEALEQPDRERHIDGGVEQDHADAGVGQAELAVHEIDRDRDRDRRHHARRQDEEQKIVGERHLEAREAIGRERAEEDREEGRAEADEIEFMKRGTTFDGPAITMLRERTSLSYQVSARRQARDEFRRLAGAHGEQVDIAFERGREQKLSADRRSRPPAT